jgi:hypothetical protein
MIDMHYNETYVQVAIAAVVLLLVAYAFSSFIAPLGVSPSNIPQAGGARFYENFIYNSSYLIPNSCLVFTADPTLFNVNGKSATQIDNFLNGRLYSEYTHRYPCFVLDVGYWCSVPGPIESTCSYIQNHTALKAIRTDVYPPSGAGYGLYYIEAQNATGG